MWTLELSYNGKREQAHAPDQAPIIYNLTLGRTQTTRTYTVGRQSRTLHHQTRHPTAASLKSDLSASTLDADIVVAGGQISRHHADVIITAHKNRPKVSIVDHSRIGTFFDLESERLIKGQPYELEDGQLVLLSKRIFVSLRVMDQLPTDPKRPNVNVKPSISLNPTEALRLGTTSKHEPGLQPKAAPKRAASPVSAQDAGQEARQQSNVDQNSTPAPKRAKAQHAEPDAPSAHAQVSTRPASSDRLQVDSTAPMKSSGAEHAALTAQDASPGQAIEMAPHSLPGPGVKEPSTEDPLAAMAIRADQPSPVASLEGDPRPPAANLPTVARPALVDSVQPTAASLRHKAELAQAAEHTRTLATLPSALRAKGTRRAHLIEQEDAAMMAPTTAELNQAFDDELDQDSTEMLEAQYVPYEVRRAPMILPYASQVSPITAGTRALAREGSSSSNYKRFCKVALPYNPQQRAIPDMRAETAMTYTSQLTQHMQAYNSERRREQRIREQEMALFDEMTQVTRTQGRRRRR
ncbi:uncharacterized protein MONBRDRAFT_38085 [Monosiga brevicollis MX1]|uniref:FHA domain-containing protein n=1 Tax=Monosiga brevicollis TaxID=81824 RepID=A9V5K6_MONBE|nr:uncharacterized protein MONBRDRAFT_38085 [Monosiga brevicollis MX1]EDQ87136.1 predicted protein [Monosiga brevicollis MX1]|eukprot:XP_001748079.1 hypothetical protein [Monosiga brevicollis MX1]